MSAEVIEDDQRTDPPAWLRTVESLCIAPDWPAGEQPIEMVQTHISVVLLGRRHVLKLKKPVDFGFLDYTTLDKRRRACEAEVRLNRRLCPATYLGVRPIIEVKGQARFSGEGRVIDHGVWMQRLPAERMLDRMVAEGAVTEAIIERVAGRLSRFHQESQRGPEVDAFGSLETIWGNWEENFTQTAPYIDRTINAQDCSVIRDWVTRWLENSEELVRRRLREGRVCDGHGDLRSESVCITDGIRIFDCIEFNDRFRCGDVAGEVAFLAMDLDARGRPDLGYYFSECYQTLAGDGELFSLLPFYRCYRAYVRGKVLSFRLDESEFSETEKESASSRAASYFDLARRYAHPLNRPTVIAGMGLSGTGKTAMARAIAGELGLRVVSADAVRHELFGKAEPPAGYREGKYSPEASRLTYQTLLDRGRTRLKEDRGVVLDATFQRAETRAQARQLAAALGAEWRLIELHLPPEVVRQRLAARAARKDGLSEATWETYLRQRDEFEVVTDSLQQHYLLLDTTGSISATSRAVTDWLRANDQ